VRAVLEDMDPLFSLSIYGPSALCMGHKSKGEKQGSLSYNTEKTRLVRHLLYLYCVSDGLRNDFYSHGTALISDAP